MLRKSCVEKKPVSQKKMSVPGSQPLLILPSIEIVVGYFFYFLLNNTIGHVTLILWKVRFWYIGKATIISAIAHLDSTTPTSIKVLPVSFTSVTTLQAFSSFPLLLKPKCSIVMTDFHIVLHYVQRCCDFWLRLQTMLVKKYSIYYGCSALLFKVLKEVERERCFYSSYTNMLFKTKLIALTFHNTFDKNDYTAK